MICETTGLNEVIKRAFLHIPNSVRLIPLAALFNMAVAETFLGSLLAVTGTYTLYLVGLVIYRLYFHPLAKFPGPTYAAISHWHEAYYDVALKGQFTFKVQELHRQYGR